MPTNVAQADPTSVQPNAQQVRRTLDRLLQLLAKKVARKLRAKDKESPTRSTRRPTPSE